MGVARLDVSRRALELGQFAESRWSPEVFRRFQCVWLGEVVGLPPQQIADAMGLHVSTIRRIRAEFERKGLAAIDGKGNRGGRRNQYLTYQEEQEFLREHAAKVSRANSVGIQELKASFESRVGVAVHKTTIYRLLERHGEKAAVIRTGRTVASTRRVRRGQQR